MMTMRERREKDDNYNERGERKTTMTMRERREKDNNKGEERER